MVTAAGLGQAKTECQEALFGSPTRMEGIQMLGSSSTASLGPPARIWIRSTAVGTGTGMPVWLAAAELTAHNSTNSKRELSC